MSSGGVGEEVGLEEHPVEGDPQPRERLALTGDHPGAGLVPELQRLQFTAHHAPQQLVGGVVAQRQLARQRIFGVLDLRAAEGAVGGDVVGVADADEVIALLVAVRPGVRVAATVHHPRHRLAHRAAGVGDQASAARPARPPG